MQYLIIFIVFLILSFLSARIGRKYFEDRRKRTWYQLIIFDALFALATLSVYFLTGIVWYVILAVISLNLLCIYLSARYLFIKVIFSRRNNKYEEI